MDYLSELPIEILAKISEYLNDTEKLKLFSITKYFVSCRNVLSWNKFYNADKIVKYDSCKNMNLKLYQIISNDQTTIHKNVTKLILHHKFNQPLLWDNLPLSITQVIFQNPPHFMRLL